MVPAELVSAAVAVGADAGAEALHLLEQLFACQRVQVFVHAALRIHLTDDAVKCTSP